MYSFTKVQIEMAKKIASFSSIYQDFHLYYSKPPKTDRESLIHFLSSYAYERQGAPKAYPKIAELVIRKIFNKTIPTITDEQCKEGWNEYVRISHNDFNISTNCKVNPMNYNIGILKRLHEKNVTNIYKYIIFLLKKNVDLAYKFIRSIRGVDTKIGSFYLRDVAYWEKMPKEISNHYALQPIDTWVEQSILFLSNNYLPKGRKKQKEWIVEICNKAGCSGIHYNQGAWVAGSVVAGDYSTYKQIIINDSLLKRKLNELILKNKMQNKAFLNWIDKNSP